MPDAMHSPQDKPKRPRAAQGTRRTGRKRTQQATPASPLAQETTAPLSAPETTGSAASQALPAEVAPVQPPSDEPAIGERWGEFPPKDRWTELAQGLQAWEQENHYLKRHDPFAAVTLSGADVYWLAAFVVGAGNVNAGKQRLDGVPPPSLTNLHLEEANLSGAQLQGAILSRTQLQGVILYGAQLQGANLSRTLLQGANLLQAQLEGADLSRTHLERVILCQAQLQRANLSEANLSGANMSEAQLQRANLSEAILSGANMSEAQLEGAILYKAQLEKANLRQARLEGATMYEAQLEKANLRQAQLERVILYEAQLQGANLSRAQLEGADLSGAQLQGATLYRTQLEGANLRQAQLQGANLSGAWLKGTNLSGARLEGADLSRTQLEGANLSRTQLQRADLRQAHLTSHVDLRWATLDTQTQLTEANLDGTLQVADVAWNGVSLIRLPWGQVPRLGDEALARQTQTSVGERKAAPQWLEGYEAAVRAYRQLAIALRSQGITDAADRFTYRALIMQRKALWWQMRSIPVVAEPPEQDGKKKAQLSPGHGPQRRLVQPIWRWLTGVMAIGRLVGPYLFSWFLAMLTGYGFRMSRIVVAYLLLISGFAAAYWSVGVHNPRDISFWTALIVSITAFHGRVFTNPFAPNIPDAQVVITAIEAIVGLVIEGVFIAMLTQRFFNR